ncbi:MAG: class I SAM-dependent methyltransferase [Thermostichus sp. DG02_5_bins_236]
MMMPEPVVDTAIVGVSSAEHPTMQLLHQHHRGPSFAERMVATSPGRFNEEFWHFWQTHIHPHLPSSPQLLDLGTGPGFILRQWQQRYPEGHFIGVDLMPYMLERAAADLQGIPGIQLLQTDLHDPHLPLDPGSIDAAQAVMVLHEMVQPLRLLQEVLRLLKPGGRFLLVDWVRAPLSLYFDAATEVQLFQPGTPLATLVDQFTHFYEHNRFSAEDLVWLLEKVGFTVVAQQLYCQNRFVRLVAQKPSLPPG